VRHHLSYASTLLTHSVFFECDALNSLPSQKGVVADELSRVS
jgi:hypothetical protein